MSAPLGGEAAPAGVTEASGTMGKKVLTINPVDLSRVPVHGDLGDAQTSPPSVEDFIRACYAEALLELGKPRKEIGEAKQSAGGVDFTVKKWRTVQDGTTWFGRTSEHEEASPVTFEKLIGCLMRNHEIHEADYTPAIFDVNTLLEWECGGMEINAVNGDILRNVEMRMTQMHHSLPGGGLISDRCFTVLLVAFSINPTQSLNMQIPIDITSFPPSLQSRSHLQPVDSSSAKYTYRNQSPDATPTQAQKSKANKQVVLGIYASIESIRLVQREGKDKGVIEWEMKTVSDAGGNMPMWMQKMAVPGAVVKDVSGALKFLIGEKVE